MTPVLLASKAVIVGVEAVWVAARDAAKVQGLIRDIASQFGYAEAGLLL